MDTYLSYRLLSRDLDKSLLRKAKESQVAREAAYFEAHIRTVRTVDEFLGDRRLYTYAMKAYGLEDMIYAKAFMRRVLSEGVADPNSFANRLTDGRYKTFAAAFDFAAGMGARASGADAPFDPAARIPVPRPAVISGTPALLPIKGEDGRVVFDGLFDFSGLNEAAFTLETKLDGDTLRTGKIVLSAETLGRLQTKLGFADLSKLTGPDLVRAINAQIEATGETGLKGTLAASLDPGGALVFTTTNHLDLGKDRRAGGAGASADKAYAATGTQRTILLRNADLSSATQVAVDLGFGKVGLGTLDDAPTHRAVSPAAETGSPARLTGSRSFAATDTLDFSRGGEVRLGLVTKLDAGTTRWGVIALNASTLREQAADLSRVTPAELVAAVNAQIDATEAAGLSGTVRASLDGAGRLVITTTDHVALGTDGRRSGRGGATDTVYAGVGAERSVAVSLIGAGGAPGTPLDIGFGAAGGVQASGSGTASADATRLAGTRTFAPTDTFDLSGPLDASTAREFDYIGAQEISFDLTTNLDAVTPRTGRITLNAEILDALKTRTKVEALATMTLSRVTPAELVAAINAQIEATGDAGLKGTVRASLDAAGRIAFTTSDYVLSGAAAGTGARTDRVYAASGSERTIEIRSADTSRLFTTGFDIGFGTDRKRDASGQGSWRDGTAALVAGSRAYKASDTIDFSGTNEVAFSLATRLDAATERTGRIVINAQTLRGMVGDLAKVTPAELLRAINAQIDATGRTGLQGAVRASLSATGRIVIRTTDSLDLGADGAFGGFGKDGDTAYSGVGSGRTLSLQNIDRTASTQTGVDIGFGVDNGPDATARSAAKAYLRQALEADAGEDDAGVRLALYFSRVGPSIRSGFDILADRALSQVISTVLNLPEATGSSNEAVSARARLIERRIDIKSFQDPKKLEAFVSRFTVMWDSRNSTPSPVLSLFGSVGPNEPLYGAMSRRSWF
ncbi:hypothetical protein GCM10007886_44070 [Methylobacterium gregans]|uniref:DUF1217 domain-containing protein n=2 Tax=Methylobacterium gregans TaxID=374424 RepID=A0AA37MCJ7_9HYPH|nr:DUF1217 domain-containing protein [Methylobacterium gregans]MDQ0519656.1 hypothetical protein [Methylobacterium gregans]GJD79938.1 hypothetical protein NBEOAGPD_3169 [Methylobacterium gregans]GLS56222.1 hypothetical protein GCM10007886_44070 [Methylobacterium gregans]